MAKKKATKAALANMVKGAAQEAHSGGRTKKKSAQLSRSAVHKIKQQLQSYGRTVQSIPIDMIDVGENIRKSYESKALKILEQSLKKDGLIQFPTLCLQQSGGEFKLICRNGHRRVMAAKNLAWDKIECVILPFDSVRDELYHSINANLREDMFYLDIAEAYQDASGLGETDAQIGERVGVNLRTVRWYRRLASMPQKCQNLVRKHPEVFNATWAIKLARSGPLPKSQELEEVMQKLLRRLDGKGAEASGRKTSHETQKKALVACQKKYAKIDARESKLVKSFLQDLARSGLLAEPVVKKIENKIFKELFSQQLGVKGRVQAKSKSKVRAR